MITNTRHERKRAAKYTGVGPEWVSSNVSIAFGFSLIELMIALTILLAVGAIVTTGMVQMLKSQGTINSRTEMHSSVRSATELLQQEVGQAGRITLPPCSPTPCNNVMPTLTTAVAVVPGNLVTQAVTVSSTAGMFNGEQVVVDAGSTAGTPPTPNQETVTISGLTTGGFTATFTTSHLAGVPIAVLGAFNWGVVPDQCGAAACTNGSDGTHLKMLGDINGDGNLVIINYDCNPSAAGNGTLTRSQTAWNAAAQGATITLLNNLANNPNNAACFVYQVQSVTINGVPTYFCTDVAITLTVQTATKDPVTQKYQQETKALLNVSPRNIFNVWERASQGTYERVQPTPPSVTTLLSQIY